MNTKSINIGLGLFGAGGLIIALYQIKTDIQREIYPVSDKIFRGLLFFAILMCVAGVVAILVPMAASLRNIRKNLDHLRRIINDVISEPKYNHFPATSDQLHHVRRLGTSLIGDGISSLDDMLEWHNKNPEIFWIIVAIPTPDEPPEIVGYFSLVPVNKKTANLLERGKIVGTGFTPDNIVAANGRPEAIYIGGIAAKSPHARAYTLACLISQVDGRNRNISVYSRPVTQRGLQLLKKYGFAPVAKTEAKLGVIFKATRRIVRHTPKPRPKRES